MSSVFLHDFFPMNFKILKAESMPLCFFILSKAAFSLWATGIWNIGRIILMFYYFWFMYYFLLEDQGSIKGWFSPTPWSWICFFSLTSPSFRILSPGTCGWHWCLCLILVLILLVLVWNSTLTVGTSNNDIRLSSWQFFHILSSLDCLTTQVQLY